MKTLPIPTDSATTCWLKKVRPISLIAVALGILLGQYSQAATRNWDGGAVGGGNNNWSNKTNWSGSGISANDVLVFGGTVTSNNNDTTAGTSYSDITFQLGSGAFILSGNSITLGGNVTNNSTNLQTIGMNASLSGTRTFDAAAGNIAVTGILSSSGAFGINKIGANTLTLSNSSNSYSGLTTVTAGTLALGANNAIGTGAVTVNGTGTNFDMGSFTDSIGAFTLTSGTLSMAANQSVTAQLTSTGAVALGTTNTLNLTGMGTTAGIYKLVAGTSLTGTFGTVTGLNSNYVLRYGTVTANQLDAQRKADQTITAPLALGRVMVNQTLTGQTLATLNNTTPTGGSNLAASASASGAGLTFTSVAPTSGTVAAQASTAITGTIATGLTTGNLTFSVSNTDANAITTTATNTGGTVTVVAKRVIANGAVTNLGTVRNGTTINLVSNAFTTSGTNSTTTSVRVAAGSGIADSNGITLNGALTDFTGAGNSGTRTFGGIISGSGTTTGSFNLATTTLENGGSGLTGEGAYGNVVVGYTAQVYSGLGV